MYKIIEKKKLAPKIYIMKIEAPRVAKAAKPGQFIILRIDEKGERIPLTIADYDSEKGTVSIVFQALGGSTNKMSQFNEGDYFEDFVGPLGMPSELIKEDIEKLKKERIVFIAGGVGTAPVYPQVKWLGERGVKVDVIIGCKSKEYLIFEEEMKKYAKNVYVATDDGSYGYKGLVTGLLKELVQVKGIKYDRAIAIGPLIMMKFLAALTKELSIKTIVSLNPIMVDGTGMCGACRVTIAGQIKFACVDGPEFDGHKVDFDEVMRRQAMYKSEESKEAFRAAEGEKDCKCRGDK